MRSSLFRFFYSSTFSFLAFITLLLTLVTPGDTIRQAWNNRQIYNIFIIGGAYVATLVISLIFYVTRLFRLRTVLADIPKFYLPIKKGDLSVKGYRVVKAELRRSAIVAWETRPRGMISYARPLSSAVIAEKNRNPFSLTRITSLRHSIERERTESVDEKPRVPAWGIISHPDHSAPVATEENPIIPPDTHYPTVVATLPNLLSAQAALVDPSLAMPPKGYSLRAYVTDVLVEVGLIEAVLGDAFVACYEKARFSNDQITTAEFAQLITILASMLRTIAESATLAPPSQRDESEDDDSIQRRWYAESVESRNDYMGSDLQRLDTGPSVRSGLTTSTSAVRSTISMTTDGTTRRKRSRSHSRSRQQQYVRPFADAQRNVSNSTVRIHRQDYDTDTSSL